LNSAVNEPAPENPEDMKSAAARASEQEVFHLASKDRPKMHPLLSNTTQFCNKILPVSNLPKL